MQKNIDLKWKQRREQIQKIKDKLEKVKDTELWTTITSKTFEVSISQSPCTHWLTLRQIHTYLFEFDCKALCFKTLIR